MSDSWGQENIAVVRGYVSRVHHGVSKVGNEYVCLRIHNHQPDRKGVDRATFLSVVCIGVAGESARSLGKGDEVLVTGRLTSSVRPVFTEAGKGFSIHQVNLLAFRVVLVRPGKGRPEKTGVVDAVGEGDVGDVGEEDVG